MARKGEPRAPGAGVKKRAPEDRPLSKKMKALADFYLVPGTSGQDAAIKAGYPAPSASSQANWVLSRPNVARYVAERQVKLQAKHDVTLDRVIQEFAKIGFANMDDYLVDDGSGPRFRLLGDIGRDKLAVVTEVTVDVRKEFEGYGKDREHVANTERVRFKLASKVEALNLLGKHLGMFPKESSGGGSGDWDPDQPRKIVVEVVGGMSRSPPKK
jgi:phage terminase small subunit